MDVEPFEDESDTGLYDRKTTSFFWARDENMSASETPPLPADVVFETPPIPVDGVEFETPPLPVDAADLEGE